MIPILQKIDPENFNSTEILVELVNKIRPPKKKPTQAVENIKKLTELIKNNPKEAAQLREYLNQLLKSKQCIQLFTESGILSNKGFFRELVFRINDYFLPNIYNDTDHTKTFNEVFYKSWDYEWFFLVPNEDWSHLFEELGLKEISYLEKEDNILTQLLNSILVLSQRVAALGLEPEILVKLPELEEFDSPFMVQNKEIFQYVENYQKEGFDKTDQNPDYKQIIVMLSQCEDYIELIKKDKRKFGADLHLTYMLSRILQNINRLRLLLKLADISEEEYEFKTEIDVLKILILTQNKRNSVAEHIQNSIGLLAFQITEHAGKTGEHYISNSTKEWWKMLLSSMGGGLIVGFLSILKVLIYYLKLAPFGEAFLYSMNYSLGFIGIHVSHSTLATKQPAMTASKLSAALDDKNTPKNEAINNLAELIVKISRSQFIAFVGNVVIAFPIAFGIAYGYFYFSGNHIAGVEKAQKLVTELDIFESYAVFHAGIAGVFLFLSGMISGYYDNKNIYYKISERLKHHKVLNKIWGKKRNERFSNYLENNLGSIAGNFFLGIFLGSTGTIGFILGLPLDIRHITFASGNFGIAVASLGTSLTQYQIAMSIAGIFSIGLMNFLVSFSLAIFVAIKARNVDFKQTRKLFSSLFKLFLRNPFNFFFPPYTRKPVDPPEENKKNDSENKLTPDDKDDKGNANENDQEKVRPVKK